MTHYETLGVPPAVSQDDLRVAFIILSKELHPDRNGGDATRFMEITAAYSVLKDKTRRREYDLLLSTTAPPKLCRTCKGTGKTSRIEGFTKKIVETCAACSGTGKV